MKVIVGLGNPGEEYSRTKHNLGFLAVDYILDSLKIQSVPKFEFDSLIYRFIENEEAILFCKPQTFMNLSGRALSKIKSFYKLKNSDFLVIYDDLYLNTGEFKYSMNKSHGGHNGVKNIIQELSGNDFLKLRVGIGPREKVPDRISDYVLTNFVSEEMKIIREAFPRIEEAVFGFIKGMDISRLMNLFN